MRAGGDMRRFWDERAREDAFYFVDNRLEYGNVDVERFWREGEADLDRLLGALGVSVQPHDRVLEIGCGVGRLTRPLASRSAEVVALDVSQEMLGKAQELNDHLSNVLWTLGNGCDLSALENDSVDACVSHVVFQHIPNPQITLGYVREMGRVLRAGGWGAFQVSNAPNIHRPPRDLRSRVRRLVRRGPTGMDSPEWLGAAVDLDDLGGAAREGGLVVEHVVGEETQYCVVRVRRAPSGP